MERLCSAALEFQATMYSLPIRAEFNIHVETLALFVKIATSVARQVHTCVSPLNCCLERCRQHAYAIRAELQPSMEAQAWYGFTVWQCILDALGMQEQGLSDALYAYIGHIQESAITQEVPCISRAGCQHGYRAEA